MTDPTHDSRTDAQTTEDMQSYGCQNVELKPVQRMSRDEAQELVNYLDHMPRGAGWIISRCIDPIGAPMTFGAYTAKVVLQGGWAGDANDNNPARAFRRAWARAHEAAASALMPKDGT